MLDKTTIKFLSTEFLKQIKASVSELRSLDSILTRIGQTSGLTKKQLKELSSAAFDAASRYGVSAGEYLLAAQKALDAGYKNASDIAGLSAALKAASGINDELAISYITTADKAFAMNGSVTELTKALDGAYSITRNSSVSMDELAKGMSEASVQAALAGMQADETTAAIATLIATAGMSGVEAGNALKDGLARATGSDNTDILNSITGNYSIYEKMLSDYSSGTSSITDDAADSVQSLDDAVTQLSSTWTKTVGNIAESDAFISAATGLNKILELVNKVTGALGSWGSIGLGAGIFAGFKSGKLK